MPESKKSKSISSSTATNSRKSLRRSTKRKLEDQNVKSHDDEDTIRFGACEMIAVYTGGDGNDDTAKDDKEEELYSFVSLCNDVMNNDLDTDTACVEWFEYNDKGHLELLDPDIHEIEIGAIICAVTVDIIELSDETWQVPDALHTSIKMKLEKQLTEEDGDDHEEDGPNYEMRMRIMRKKKGKRIKMEGEDCYDDKPKRGKKKKVTMGDVEEPNKKRGKVQKKSAKTIKGGKVKLIPRPEIKLMKSPWTKKTGKLNSYNGDTHIASKEVIRAYLSKDTSIFKKILKDDKVVADLFANQSCDVEMDVLSYAILNEDKNAVKSLWEEISHPSNLRPPLPECTLLEITSGKHTSKYADYNRYKVAASRGSKEGNNAFASDMSCNSYRKGRTNTPSGQDIVELFCTNDVVSIPFVEFLDKEFFDAKLFSYGFNYHELLVHGHRALAQDAMKRMLNRGAGLNHLHTESLGDGDKIEKILPVSVEKKSSCYYGCVRFCPVHCAASNGNPTYLKQFLAVKPEAVNCVDSDEATLIHYAAVGDKPDTLKWLLEGPGVTLNRNEKMRKGSKSTPLMWAARAARAENIRVLCEGQSDDMFKVKDVSGRTAFHYVAYSSRKGRLETAKALIDCGANPDIYGDTRLLNKQTPLMICAARGDLDLLKVLVEVGKSKLTVVDKLGRTPLMFAAKNGQVHVMSYLLRAGVSVDAEDSSENTAMHYAAAYGWVDCVKILFEVGANFDPKNNWASTPLELALKKGRFACAIVLLKEKVDVNVRDKNGVSLFNSLVSSYMAQLSRNKKAPLPWAINQIMNREELDVTCVDSSDQTVFHLLAKGNVIEGPLLKLVDELLSRGTDPLKMDKDGRTAAEVSLKNRNFQLCLKLLKHVSHTDIGAENKNLLHLLMPYITDMDETLFMNLFSTLHETNGDWSKRMDDAGVMPLLYAARAVRIGWEKYEIKGKGKNILEKLFDILKERVGDTSGRRVLFRNWSDNLIKNGKLVWSDPSEEYTDGSRTVLHEILQCPDVDWALQMSCKILKQTMKVNVVKLLHLKSNEGKDALAFAFDSFIHAKTPINPTLKLIQLLRDNGAPMDNIEHPLFSALSEAQADLPEVEFNAMNCCLDDACHFVLYQRKKEVKALLQSPGGKQTKEVDLFTPRIIQILRRPKDRRPTIQLLKGLIEKCGLSVNTRDFFGNIALHLTNDSKVVEQLILSSDINAINNQGKTPLIMAVNNVKLVKLLIANGADANISYAKGTALHIAVHNGRGEVVEELIKTCNVDITDDKGRTALHHAVALRAVVRDEMLNPPENQLLLAGANVNARDKFGRTPLYYCFFSINADTTCTFPPANPRDPIDMVTTLAGKNDIDFNTSDKDMRTPLHYAAAVGASICVLYLCARGKSVCSVDSDNNTPLALALRADRADTATLLISKGSNLNIQVHDVQRSRSKHGIVQEISKQVQPALWFALRGNGCQSVARYMLAAKEVSMKIILYSLLSTGNFQLTMQQIKLCGAEKKMQTSDDETGRTGLHLLGRVESFAKAPAFASALADAMVNAGISVTTKCKKGRTVLHEASLHGHIELCRHLISTHHADVDVQDFECQTPLSLMFQGHAGDAELVCVLSNASKNPKILVNAAVKGNVCDVKEKKWNDIENVGKYLLSTSNNLQHAEEVFIQRLSQEKVHSTKERRSTKIISSTPLIEAVLRKDTKLVNALFTFGANSEGVDENGRTALHHAVISENVSMLNLLLRWNCDPVNVLDKFNRSALSYAVLTLIHKEENALIDLLFEYGANPLVGGALELATKINQVSLVKRMLNISQRSLLQRKKISTGFNVGDLAWVRHHSCASWELSKIISTTDSRVDIIPWELSGSLIHSDIIKESGSSSSFNPIKKVLTLKEKEDLTNAINEMTEDKLQDAIEIIKQSTDFDPEEEEIDLDIDNIDNVTQRKLQNFVLETKPKFGETLPKREGKEPELEGNATALHGNEILSDRFKTIYIQDISNVDICVLDTEVDLVVKKVEDVLLPLLPAHLSLKEKQTLIEEYKGYEYGLQEKIKTGPQKEALFSKLTVGDIVGYLEFSSCIPNLQIGTVTAAHLNGQYDIYLYNGKSMKQLNRIHVRPLRNELCVTTKPKAVKLCTNLVHACVRPVKYGAFENLELLQALIAAGAPADGKNDKDMTPLNLARPGSAIQNYLQKVTNSRQSRPLPSEPCTPHTDGIDFKADADAELTAMLTSGLDSSERVIPRVSSVCELDSNGTCVMTDGNDFFDVALTKVDVQYGQYGKYVFYKMQIVHDTIRNTYVLLTNWGRIGENGKYQQTPFTSKEDCIKEFKKVFKSKSGNEWNPQVEFVRKAGKYALVLQQKTRLKHPEKLLQGVVESSNNPCSLPTSVGDMIRFFLDPEALSSAYSCSKIDSSRLPFGELAVSTIQAAEAKLLVIKEKLNLKKKVLKANGNIQEVRAAFEEIAKASSEFYELLPMGDDQIVEPLDEDQLGKAFNLIQQLRDLTITKQLVLGGRHRQASMNPIDYVYKALGVNITPLNTNSIERNCLLRYIDNTCSDPNIIIHQIYALNDGKQACDIPNKQLLFHASKNQNIPGILKHGLLICPPEAPKTGWLFGKGIYFADQINKAIGYASNCSNKGNKRPRAFVFVAEVALGVSYLPSKVEYIEKLPEGTHSIHAIGEKAPDKARELILDVTGAGIPLGELKKSKVDISKSRWSKRTYNNCGSITDADCRKIEKIRLDPSTKFPASIGISCDGKKQTLTLLTPYAKTGMMSPSISKDEDNVDMNDDEIRIDISNSSNTSLKNTGTSVYRLTNDGNHITGFSEFVVFDTKQVRLKYLIEVTSATWLKKEFHKKNFPSGEDTETNLVDRASDESESQSDDESESESEGSDY